MIGGYYTVMGAIGQAALKIMSPFNQYFTPIKCTPELTRSAVYTCHGGAQESKHANIPSMNV